MPATAAKILPFNPDNLIVDAAFTSRHSEVHIRTGPHSNTVSAEVDLDMEDKAIDNQAVYIRWTMKRYVSGGDGLKELDPHPYPHSDISFAVDEIEAFATALYQAVQLAKMQGYLPKGGNR